MWGYFIGYLRIFLNIPGRYYLCSLLIGLAAGTAVWVYERYAGLAAIAGDAGFPPVSCRLILAWGLLAAWLFFTLADTVFCREPGTSRSMQLRLFWSYRSQSREYLVLDLFNILLLLPAGFLLPLCGVKRFRRVLIVGFLWSLMLETLQFITRRGLFEADDLFHNTLGACLGYLIFMLAVRIRKRRRIR